MTGLSRHQSPADLSRLIGDRIGQYAMAFQSAPNCAEAVIRQVYGGQNVVNVLNFRHAVSYDQVQLDILAATIDDWYSTEVLPLLTDGLTYVSTDVRGLQNEQDLSSSDASGTGVGGVVGAGAPNNVALCVTHYSRFTGRSARGRTYQAGIPQTVLDTAVSVNSTFRANLEYAYQTIISYVAATSWDFVILSRFGAGVKRPLAITFDVYSIRVRNVYLDSQRGRLVED